MEKELLDKIKQLFESGLTHQEIGNILGKPRRTIMRECQKIGLKRSASEAASLKIKSALDDENIIKFISENRNLLSLEEIAVKFNSSISSVQRICCKHGITLNKDLYKANQSEKMKNAWDDDKKSEARDKSLKLVTDELRSVLSASSKELWKNECYREKQIEIQTKIWNTPENRRRLAEWRVKQSGKLSSIQKILYSILDDLGIKYFKEGDVVDEECIIGPYNFDCVIPREGKRNLVIECQGDYWHTLDKAIRIDKSKATYLEKYYSETHELKYLWEHEFACQNRISELIKYWTGQAENKLIEFDFCDIEIKKSNAEEYRMLLSKYHYLPNAGKGGIAIGAYLNNELIAICVFSKLIRQNIKIYDFDNEEVIELSRLCIHPNYQMKNLASWFVSRCMKMLNDKIKCVVSYCDTTHNHDGAVYKSLNFTMDKEVRPDYWYSNENGWVMHKKTLYNKAVKMNITELEYAEKFGYKKIFGSKKMRFIFIRK